MIEVILASGVSAVLMRIKGGGYADLDAKGEPLRFFGLLNGRGASAVLFAGLVGFLTTSPYIEFFGGLGVSPIVVMVLHVLLAGGFWWLGNSMHVRNYLLALGGYRGSLNPREGGGDARIDKIVFFFMNYVKVTPLAIQAIHGGLGTCLRGLTLGIPLSLLLLSPWPALAGAAMPVAYFAGISVNQYRFKSRTLPSKSGGWFLGEYFWGAFIGASICL